LKFRAAPDPGFQLRRVGHRNLADAATDSGLQAPELAVGVARPNAPGIATTQAPRDRAIIAVLLGCAQRRCEVAALTDGRSSGAFTPEATGAARHANTPELSV